MVRVLYVLTAIIQFSFAFHALRAGKGPRWIMIIILAPVIGCLLYYFMEVFPNSREDRTLRRRVRDIAKAINPDAELHRRSEEVATSASVDNRAALADECLAKGMFDDAVRLYESCLEGPHKNDASILFSCARAHFYNGGYRQAEELLARLAAAHPKFRRDEVELLQARVLEALGDTQGALTRYDALCPRYVGFEARYRHGLMLQALGRAAEADAEFTYIASHARRSAIESEQEWVKLAAKAREQITAKA